MALRVKKQKTEESWSQVPPIFFELKDVEKNQLRQLLNQDSSSHWISISKACMDMNLPGNLRVQKCRIAVDLTKKSYCNNNFLDNDKPYFVKITTLFSHWIQQAKDKISYN